MSSTIVQDIAGYLAAEGHGILGTSIFYGQTPDKPDILIGVLDNSGDTSIYADTFVGSISIIVRHTRIITAIPIVSAIYTSMHDKKGITGTIHTVEYSRVKRRPMYLGPDIQGRHGWSISVELYAK
jgi:hypothetical protein